MQFIQIIANLQVSDFVSSQLSEINTTPSIACGVLMALRVLRHLGCPADISSTGEGKFGWVL